MKDEHIFDTLERMESIIPEYGYGTVRKVVGTDVRIRAFVLSEVSTIKDYMFHVVQVSFELQKDKLTEAAEDVWDEMKHLMNRVEVSRVSKLKSKKDCDDCQKRVQDNMFKLIKKDRELVIAVKDMKSVVYSLYRELFTKGREHHFIKNLGKIKTYIEDIISIVDERDGIITGG